ncbi:PHD-finger [Necator americanus]|uniref:PHD-finger n=1 Tax=Necator americanus TaxID=51031 RepID=W2SMP8_NECAM|nr:PHD-finger [Necator americanus]ETN70141.1 PHD-finger [Necator americanus]
MLGLKPTSSHLTSCNMEFEPIDDTGSVGSERDSNGTISPMCDRKLGGRHKLTNGKSHREKVERSASPRSVTSESTQSGITSGNKLKIICNIALFSLQKRKYQNDAHTTISNYARRKQEKERDRLKSARVHAARQEENQRKQAKLALSSDLDVASFCKTASDLAPISVKTEENIPSEDDIWKGQDPLGSEDDFDANDVLGLFPTLPSPPREIMESLKEESLFGLEDDISFDPHSKAFSQSPAVSGLVFDSLPSSPSASVSSWDKKKRTSISFGNVCETTSMHGRPRKMTERAVELLQNNKDREERKRKVEIVDGEAYERWCFCREVSSGSMICCDAPDCKYQWFHFECVGLVVEPKGQWFCSECAAKRH